MYSRREFAKPDIYPWSPSETARRGCTAPRPDYLEPINCSSRLPTSSLKYASVQTPVKLSSKSPGWPSQGSRGGTRTISSYYKDPYFIPRPGQNFCASPEIIEHVSEEGGKRPKTQNEKSRRKNSASVQNQPLVEVFPVRPVSSVYDVPIIVVRDDKRRRGASARRDIVSKTGKRPATFKPNAFVSSLDQEFLDLFKS